MRATLLIALSVLCGCTSTASRKTRLSSERRSASLCWWRDSGWGDGVVLARHSVKALGRVRSLEDAQVMATATLRTGGSVPVLEGKWTGPGLVLEGDVDVGTVPALASWEPRRIGAVGLLQKG
ncbi:MAG: hypothetical protein ACO1OB_22315, partial [Archangium sp.]